MQNLAHLIQATNDTLINLSTKTIASDSDRKQMDVAVNYVTDNLTKISDNIELNLADIPLALTLVETIKGFGMGYLVKDLESGIAYASR